MSSAKTQPTATHLPALVDGAAAASAVEADRTAAEEAARKAVQRLFTATGALAVVWVLAWGATLGWLARGAWPAAELATLLGAACGVLVAAAWLVIGNAGMARAWVRGDGSALATWTGAEALSTGFDRLVPGAGAPLDPADAAWVELVRDVAQQLGLARPKVFVWASEPSINALAAGWTPSTTALVITRGALDKLSPRELRALATHQLLNVRSGQARFQLAATSLIWGFGWVRWAAEHRRQPDLASGEAPSPLRHLLGSIGASAGLPGLPFAQVLQRHAAQGRAEASDRLLAENCPDLRVPMATVLQKVWYEADNRADRLRHARLALLRPFLLWGPGGGPLRTHPALADRVRALSGQDGLPLATGPLGAALDAAAQAASRGPNLAHLDIEAAATPAADEVETALLPAETPADWTLPKTVDSPQRVSAEAWLDVREPAEEVEPSTRTVIAPARWAAALAAADAQAAGPLADVPISEADAAAAAAALGVMPTPRAPAAAASAAGPRPAAPQASSRTHAAADTAAKAVAPASGLTAPPPPTAVPPPRASPSIRAGRPVVPETMGRFMTLPPAPDADSPEGRELARLVGMALPVAATQAQGAESRPEPRVQAAPLAGGLGLGPDAAGAGRASSSAAVRDPSMGARRPQRWRRATASGTAGGRSGRRGTRPARLDTPTGGEGSSGFGATSGWHSGFDPGSGFGPLGGFDPQDDTPLPPLPPIPPLGVEATQRLDRSRSEAATPAPSEPPVASTPLASPLPVAPTAPAAGTAAARSESDAIADLARVVTQARAVQPPRSIEDPQAPLVRAALGLPPPPAGGAAGSRTGSRRVHGQAARDPIAIEPPSAPRLPPDGFAPTEFLVRQGVSLPAVPEDPGELARSGAEARASARRTAAMLAAEQALARDAAQRLHGLTSREELRAAILGFMLSTDSRRERAAWKTEVGGTNVYARILDDLAAQPREALMPWFGELVRRAAHSPLEERRALVESARRVMTAAGVVKPLDRLRWLTLRHGLGSSSRKLQVAPAVPPEDQVAFFQAHLPSIATFTAFLARMIPVYAADVGIDPVGERWYQAVLQRFIGVGSLPPCRVPDSDSLVHALRALQALSWINRPPLVRAWVAEALGQTAPAGLAQEAADALFMACLLLDSPMPGELARYFPSVTPVPALAGR